MRTPPAGRKPRPSPRGRRSEIPPPIPTVSGDDPAHPEPPAEASDDDEAIRRMIEAAYT